MSDIVDVLLRWADSDDQTVMGKRKPDPTSPKRIAAAEITRLRAELAEARAKAFEEAAGACEAERLCEPQDENDAAYDNAIDHCVEAIRAMIDKE